LATRPNDDFVFVSVAADAEGADAARPWHEAAGASFDTVIDADNTLGRLLDYKIIPNGLFLDENGNLVGKWIGFSVDRPECIDSVEAFRSGHLEPFERNPQGPVGQPGVAPGPLTGAGALTPVERELYDTRVRFGAELLAAGKKEPAAAEWKKALLMDPDNFVLRKQVWRLQFPEKFGPQIDFEWQKERLAMDRAEEAEMLVVGCGPEGCIIPQR
jgi:hypothetical protein